MENKEFKRIWEKASKKLFDIEQKKAAVKYIPGPKKLEAKPAEEHQPPEKHKNKVIFE